MAAQRRTGLAGNNPLAKKRSGGVRSSVVGATSSAPLAGEREIPVADLAPNPNNPAWRGDVSADLAESVASIGILQPLVVQAAEKFLAQYPDLSGVVGDRAWVVLAGHQRLAAAVGVGLASVPVVVRDDVDSDQVMVAENTLRVGLGPIDEALIFQRSLANTGLSQRALAKHLGVPQSQISKRARLLVLPEVAHEVVNRGDVTLADAQAAAEVLEDRPDAAEAFAEAFQEETLDGFRGQAPFLTRASEIVTALDRSARVERVRALAERDGVTFIETPSSQYPDWWDRILRTEEAVKEAEADGTLAMLVDHFGAEDGVEHQYMTTGRSQGSRTRANRDERRRDEDQLRLTASKARTAAVVKLLGRKSTAGSKLEPLRQFATLNGMSMDYDISKVAWKISREAGLVPAADEVYEWRRAVGALSLGSPEALMAAAAVTLAIFERATSSPHVTRWGPAALLYMRWLIAAGYSPTEWERQMLAEGDSVESPAVEEEN